MPDNDLRLEVARILGWTSVRYDQLGDPVAACPERGDRPLGYCLPDWPNDDAAAVRDVLPVAIECDLDVRIGGSKTYGWWCMVGDINVANAKTLARAICEAFLAATKESEART